MVDFYKQKKKTVKIIPFSAFWLRSSVVSVLISLISDTWVNGPLDIKVIFYGGGSATVACYWGSLALSVRCTTALAWRTPPIPISRFQSGRSAAFVLKLASSSELMVQIELFETTHERLRAELPGKCSPVDRINHKRQNLYLRPVLRSIYVSSSLPVKQTNRHHLLIPPSTCLEISSLLLNDFY
ncbi:uncharacterized protein LOC122721922 [Manihot esculenta]|uniref:uncharacterized protein LOC122721922 n=1 Tax=Manihot esculenta TaxID=3983 RepID=UPI001CC3E838|nr:uncharacterized protein LOC122721922 [Manihot esculenta]